MKNTEEVKVELAKSHPNDPLHGKTLKFVVEFLFAKYGWERLGQIIKIKCFNVDPSLKSALTFLRKTDWARKQVEDLYVSVANPREMRER
jgi:uncharacterized protein (DUF2132 family)